MLYINSLLLAVFSMASLALYHALIPVDAPTVETALIETTRPTTDRAPTILRHDFESEGAEQRIAARPLFSPSRRPVEMASAPLAETPIALPMIALNGVSMVGGERRALVTIGEQTVRTLGEGDMVDGWTIARIMPREIDLQRGAATHTFSMQLPGDDTPPRPVATTAATEITPLTDSVGQPAVDMTDALD